MPRPRPARGAGQQRLELVQPGCGRVVAREAGRPLELVDNRIERAVLVIGRAVVAQAEYAARAWSCSCMPRSMRDLPIPGSPESSTTWPSPALARAQRRAAARSPARGRPAASAPAVQCLEPALDALARKHLPGRHRLGEALSSTAPRSRSRTGRRPAGACPRR